MDIKTLSPILAAFRAEGTPVAAEEMKSGNINATWRVDYECRGARSRYILQRVNTYVFREPGRMMENIRAVTEHLRRAVEARGEDPARRVLRMIPTQAGEMLYTDEKGSAWRMYVFIDDAFAYDAVDAAAFLQVGRGFGRFQRLLADFPAEQLYASIPDFHNTPQRIAQLEAAIREDRVHRAAGVREEIDFLLSRREVLCSVTRLIDAGELPLRVTHNDTKSNNVMLDRATGEALCVIDLDTVMPGSVLYDYGDAIRFGGNTAAEDEPDTAKISLDMEKTEAFTRGFIEETNGFLLENELRRLPLGIQVMTGELALRFLTDYLNGDVYFKTLYPEHNLVRTRAQMALLKDVERRESDLAQMIEALLRS